jgi:ubiquinone/menaquinone biosynthesis C-methylase UbiE
MNLEEHWERIYRTRQPQDVSWFRLHLQTSLELISQICVPRDAPILDVGGGASTLVADLLAAGYSDLTVVDLSEAALETARARLGRRGSEVAWIAGDATRVEFAPARFHVWHDRAVFHFLMEEEDRRRYVEQVRRAVAPGGHVIIATFGPEGPLRCSGLPTARYEADALHAVFGSDFSLVDRREERHRTPAGAEQQFVYCL